MTIFFGWLCRNHGCRSIGKFSVIFWLQRLVILRIKLCSVCVTSSALLQHLTILPSATRSFGLHTYLKVTAISFVICVYYPSTIEVGLCQDHVDNVQEIYFANTDAWMILDGTHMCAHAVNRTPAFESIMIPILCFLISLRFYHALIAEPCRYPHSLNPPCGI